jgi:Tol biopolymer transport system component
MSPEQARGKAVDERSDIWAFGCVFYEMLTGKAPFTGETVTDTIAAVLDNEPDWQALPQRTPQRVRSLIMRCLRKDPAQRLRNIADGRFQLEDVSNDPGGSTVVVSRKHAAREWAAWIVAALLLGTTLFFATRSSTSPAPRAISLPVFPPPKAEFSARINTTLNVPSFALSPDGQALVFSAQGPGGRPVLWLRSLDRVDARLLAGTENSQDPFWSPDGRWIGFFADGTLRKVPAVGGEVQVITQARDTPNFRGATWGARNTILFAGGIFGGREGLLSVNAAGGPTTPVTFVETSLGEDTHRNPSFLPDGNHFLYSIIANGDQSGVYVGSLDGKTKKPLVRVLTSAVYAPPGYLLFVEGDTLRAQAFDADRLELKGQPFFVAERVGRSTSFRSGISAAMTGTIAYAPLIAQNGRLEWIDRLGNPAGSPGTREGDYADFRLSPDQNRLAASLGDPKTNVVDIWITDLARGSTSRVVSDGGALSAAAVWSPDGNRLAFRSNRTGVIALYDRSAAGGGADRPVLSRNEAQPSLVTTDWSPNGQLIGSASAPGSGHDLWLVPVGNDAKPAKFIDSPADQMHGNFSPNGRLVAYTSNESGRFEIYVETVPRSDRKWPVSTDGGYEPRWRADGREIYYLSEDRRLMAVPVSAGPSFGIPKPLFQTRVPVGVTPYRTHYVPGSDGQRFLVNVASDTVASPITVVLNWTALLNK